LIAALFSFFPEGKNKIKKNEKRRRKKEKKRTRTIENQAFACFFIFFWSLFLSFLFLRKRR
jgi:hypothetical protein